MSNLSNYSEIRNGKYFYRLHLVEGVEIHIRGYYHHGHWRPINAYAYFAYFSRDYWYSANCGIDAWSGLELDLASLIKWIQMKKEGNIPLFGVNPRNADNLNEAMVAALKSVGFKTETFQSNGAVDQIVLNLLKSIYTSF